MVTIRSHSVVKGSPLVLTASEIPANLSSISWSISRILQDYTLFSAAGSSSPIPNDHEYIFEIPPSVISEAGLYNIDEIKLNINIPQEPPIPIGLSCNSLFQIRCEEDSEKSIDDLNQLYNSILEWRKNDFLSGIGNGEIEYEALVFMKNILVTSQMVLGQCEVMHFNGLKCNDELELIGQFLSDNNLPSISNIDEIIQKAVQGQPVIIVYFPRIKANNENDAGMLAEREANLIGKVLAINRGGAAEIFGSYLINRRSPETYYRVALPHYGGNLIGGIISGEDPGEIKTQINSLRNSDQHQLYVGLYHEALRENNPELKYFRFWSLLEAIARSKNYIGRNKTDWNNNTRINRRGQPILIQSASDIVFELIRESLSGNTAENCYADGLQQGSITQMIEIWYRRRNCIVHGGECLCRNPNSGNTDDKYVNCKAARDEMVVMGFGDQYLRNLEEITKNVLRRELSSLDGTV